MITFFTEKGEVGGNQILLKEKGSKLWLDFGLSFKKAKRIISLLLEGRQLPKYRLSELARKRMVPPPSVIEGRNSILLTHAHMDHYGGLDILFEHRIETRIYAPRDLLNLLKARLEAANKLGLLLECNTRLFPLEVGKVNSIEDMEVVPVKVDHSIDGSYGYLVFTPEGVSIFYTGDIRFDLKSSIQVIHDIKAHTDEVDIVVTELTGTNVRTPLKETEISVCLEKLSKKYDGFVIVFTTPSYTKRIEAIKKAFKKRKLVIDTTYAHYLHALQKDNLIDNLFVSSKKRSLTSWERRLTGDLSEKVVDENFLETHQRECVLIISPYKKLRIDFDLVPKSVAIISLCEPFDEESFYVQSKLDRFLAEWKRIPAYNVHAPGHADVYEISEFINKLNPDKIFVIHSTSPEVISNVMPLRRNIFTPTYGETFKTT